MAMTTSKRFNILASVIGVSLLLVTGYLILQPGVIGGGQRAALAALSQALPVNASDAIAGEADAFDQLGANAQLLAETMQQVGSGAAGDVRHWTSLESGAASVLAQRPALESWHQNLAQAETAAEDAAILADGILNVSGATSAITSFQSRSRQLVVRLKGLPRASNGSNAVEAINSDLAYLRAVTNALEGRDSPLDIAPIDPGSREDVLVPVVGKLVDLESTVGQMLENDVPGTFASASAAAEQMHAAAGELLPALTAESSSGPSTPWFAVLLLIVSILLVATMVFLNRQSAAFERTSIEQSQQNERNQKAILRLLDELGSLADGDLTVEATVTEEITGAIADSINYAIEKLRELVATINDTAIMVDSAAKQTENTAVHMARAAENQGLEISAATESIVSMAASIEEVSGNAERSSDVARHSVEVAHKGGEAVRRTIDGMNAIRETIQDTSKRIKRLGESSQEIGNIVELINDIAEQTNILALNASIQASMAGEAGRGFAVVADEVQRLAERSTNATKQIEVLVRTIQADTNEAVISMERSTTDVVGGALLAENAGAALDEIEQVSNQIANLVQNISGSARNQAGAAADVTRRTTKLKEISEQTGRATTATAAAISKLSELASQLRQTVAGFTLPGAALKSSPISNVSSEPRNAQVRQKGRAAG